MLGFSGILLVVITLLSVIPQAYFFSQFGSTLSQAGTATGDAQSLDATIGPAATALQASLVPGILQFIAVSVLNAILVVAVSGAVLGQRMPPGLLWSRVKGRIWAVFGLTLLTSLAVFAILVVGVTPGIVLAVVVRNVATVVLAVLLGIGAVVAAVFAGTRWSMAGPALLLEEASVTTAMRRSWRLTTGSFWRVLGILVLTQIIVGFGSGLVGTPFSVGGGILSGLGLADQNLTFTVLGLLVTGIGQIVAGTVFYPFTAAVTALIYVDLRMRREGLGVELMRAAEAPRG
jgi:hypothetical protein